MNGRTNPGSGVTMLLVAVGLAVYGLIGLIAFLQRILGGA